MQLTGITLTAVVLLLGCVPSMPEQDGLSDIFEILERQGYQANVGLSGIYEPGNVIQTTQDGPDGQPATLASPIVFVWGSDCFPDRNPRVAPFALPDSQGSQASGISIDAGILSLLIPSLKFSHQTVSDYRLDLENTRVYTFAKGNLSRQFSEKCVRALAQALEDGDKIEWFSIIIEAVIAESITLEMNWQSGSTVEARSAQQNQIMQRLGAILSGYSKGFRPPSSGLELQADNEKKSVIRTDGPVIIGYRSRPLQPVYKK